MPILACFPITTNFKVIKISAWLFTSNWGFKFLHPEPLETLDEVAE